MERRLAIAISAPLTASRRISLILMACLISCGSLVTAQITKTGACPNYQTDRNFDVSTATELYGKTLYFSHTLPNTEDANHTCTKITFNSDHTFKYDYVDGDGILTYYDGRWSVFPTTVTNPGTIVLQFQYINILGSDMTGQTTLYALYSTAQKLLTLASCNVQPFNYHKEYLYTLATKEVASIPQYYDLLKSILIYLGTPNSRQLMKVTQDCF